MRLAAVLLAAGLIAGTGSAQLGSIVSSAHDFSTASWNTGAGSKQGQICGVCHIPHVEGRPADRTDHLILWGRQLSTATYVMYSSFGLNGTQSAQPDGSTTLCLGCHDGTVALELFHTKTTGTTFIDNDAKVPGKVDTGSGNPSFAADHPISITYEDSTGTNPDPGLKERTSSFGSTGKTIGDFLEGGKVQCVTCHDPHNNVAVGNPDFLHVPVAGSVICLACHIK